MRKASRLMYPIVALLVTLLVAGCVPGATPFCVPHAKGLLGSGCPDAAMGPVISESAQRNLSTAFAEFEEKRVQAAMIWAAASSGDAPRSLAHWATLCRERGGSFIEGRNEVVGAGSVSLSLPGNGWCLTSPRMPEPMRLALLDGGWISRDSLGNPDNNTAKAAAHTFYLKIMAFRSARELTPPELGQFARLMVRQASVTEGTGWTESMKTEVLGDVDPGSCASMISKGEGRPKQGPNRFLIQDWMRICSDRLDRTSIAIIGFREIRRADDPGADARGEAARDAIEQLLNSRLFRTRP